MRRRLMLRRIRKPIKRNATGNPVQAMARKPGQASVPKRALTRITVRLASPARDTTAATVTKAISSLPVSGRAAEPDDGTGADMQITLTADMLAAKSGTAAGTS